MELFTHSVLRNKQEFHSLEIQCRQNSNTGEVQIRAYEEPADDDLEKLEEWKYDRMEAFNNNEKERDNVKGDLKYL